MSEIHIALDASIVIDEFIGEDLACHGFFIQPRPKTDGHLRPFAGVEQSVDPRNPDRVQARQLL